METGDILQILADAVSVFDANIKSFLSFGLEPGQIIGRAGYGTLLPVHLHLSVDVAYQLIHSVNGFQTVLFIARALAHPACQVLSIQFSFSHLGQANLRFFARTYIIGNVKIKWGVCMRVEGEDAAVNLFGMPVGSCLLNQKIEESGRDAVACRSQSFGMELHTPYRIFVGRLYSFGNTV